MKKGKRVITPYKGGRNITIRARVTEKEKAMIDEARKELSYADYVVQKATKDVNQKNP